MNKVIIAASDFEKDASEAIRKAADRYEEDVEICFEKGIYPIFSAVDFEHKKSLVLNGNGSTLLAHFDREQDVEASTEIFHFNDCENITLKGFKVDSDMSCNTACRILDVTEKYADIEVDAEVPFNGKEYYIDGTVFTRSEDPELNGENRAIYWLSTPYDPTKTTVIAGELACTNPRRLNVPHESLGGQKYRVYSTNLGALEPGMTAIIQHSYYGLVAFTFKNTDTALIEDVHISDYGGFGFIILPRCRDFTFRRLRFESEDKVHQIYSSNSDGIHITGLSGNLLLEDCYFESLGDDTINIHTQVLDVEEVCGNKIRLIYNKKNGIISAKWGLPGDVLKVYDNTTLEEKGEIRIKECKDGWITAESISFPLGKGDLVTNQHYFVDAVFRRVTVSKQRNRSLCIQSVRSLLVEDCDFRHVGNASVYLSTAFNMWREAGPVSNAVIRNCRFSAPVYPMRRAVKLGVVHLWLNGQYFGLPHVHHNILVEKNTFIGFRDRTMVNVSSTDGVIVRDNVFEDCTFEEEEPVLLTSCSDVTVGGNKILNH